MSTVALTGDLLPACAPLSNTAAVGGPGTDALVEEWLLGYASTNTRDAYRRDVAHWLRFLASGGVDPLADAGRLHTHAWLRAQEAEGAATATRARRLAAVSALYGWLIAEDRYDRANPASIDRRRKPRVDPDSTATRSLTRAQADALLAAADADTSPQATRAAVIVALLLYTGIRVSELVGADVEQLGHDGGHRTLRLTVKGGRIHQVPLPAPVTRRLDPYLDGRDDLTGDRLPVPAGHAGAGTRTRRPLVATATGRRLDRGAVWRLLRRLARAAAIPGLISPHVLRHACATLAREAGAELADVQNLLGHADPRTTGRYDHGRGRLDRSPAYALARYLTG